jgi:hypothetical protein
MRVVTVFIGMVPSHMPTQVNNVKRHNSLEITSEDYLVEDIDAAGRGLILYAFFKIHKMIGDENLHPWARYSTIRF